MKVVIVLDKDLPVGVQANAAAVLAFSASGRLPGAVGCDLVDGDGSLHPGITNVPLPVLACEEEGLRALREKARSLPQVACVDFPDVAQRARNYADYEASLGAAREADLRYLGLCIYGEPSSVRRLTGHLALVK